MKADGVVQRLVTHYAWPHRWSFFAGAVCLLVTNWLTVTIPIQLGMGIDALGEGGDVSGIVWTIAAMGLAVVVVRTLSRVLFFNPGRSMEYQIRKNLFEHLLALQPHFYSGHRTGDIVSRASSDISWTRAMIGFGLMQAVNTTVAISLTGWRMVGISLELTLWAIAPILVALAVVQLFLRKLFDLQKQSQEQLGAISDHVLDSFQGVATVQGFAAEDAFVGRLEKLNYAWLMTNMRLSVIRSTAFPLLGMAGGAAIFALLYVGGPMAVQGPLSVGDLAAFATLIGALVPPLRSLGWMLSVLQRGRAALERIFELIDEEIDCPEGDDPAVLPSGSGPSVSFRSLSFAYPDEPDRIVLDDVNVEILPGTVVGIFGKTGSGKTTLLRLMARLFDPPAGTLFVDEADICSVDRAAWRKRMAVAPQRPFLFSETIEDNITLGMEPGAESAEVATSAATSAALDSDLRVLPHGMQTVVGQRGIMLSGGQRQRVALARALVRNADLVLLDDVLSAVDHQTEAALVESLRDAGKGRQVPPTVVIVSNRVSALRHADNIVVLDEGRVSDQGTHDELVSRPGVYQEIWEVQRS